MLGINLCSSRNDAAIMIIQIIQSNGSNLEIGHPTCLKPIVVPKTWSGSPKFQEQLIPKDKNIQFYIIFGTMLKRHAQVNKKYRNKVFRGYNPAKHRCLKRIRF